VDKSTIILALTYIQKSDTITKLDIENKKEENHKWLSHRKVQGNIMNGLYMHHRTMKLWQDISRTEITDLRN
jgi:hypothetical protein